MAESTRLDQVRAAALERIERAERKYKIGVVYVAAWEGLCLVAFLVLMDFRDRLHWLILIAACLTYGIAMICMLNLGIYVQSSAQAILRAILVQRPADEEAPRA